MNRVSATPSRHAGPVALCLSASAFAQYPNRPITLIVPWGAGGGTDAAARIIGSLLEKDLGQPVNVVNRTGGSGVVGHSAIATAAPDGYTSGIITVEIAMMHWPGLTQLDPASYTPIGLVNLDPAGSRCAPTRRYKTLNDCSTRSRPIRASSRLPAPARAASGTWRWPACCSDLKIDPARALGAVATAPRRACRTWPPAASSSCPARCPRRVSLIDAGKVRSLAMMAPSAPRCSRTCRR